MTPSKPTVPLRPIALNWTAPESRGAGGGKAAEVKEACDCTGECGDDPRIKRGLVKPCSLLLRSRAERADAVAWRAEAMALRAVVVSLVNMMERMDYEKYDRPPMFEDETDARMAEARAVLSSGLSAKGIEAAPSAAGSAASGKAASSSGLTAMNGGNHG